MWVELAIHKFFLLIQKQNYFLQRLMACIAGGIASFSFAPFHYIVLFIFSWPCLIWLLDGQKTRWNFFSIGWWFAFGHALVGNYWVANSFMVQGIDMGWLAPIAVFCLAGWLALIFALLLAFFYNFWSLGLTRIFLLAEIWAAHEWVRGHLITGYPWNLTAYIWGNSLPIMQLSSWIGSFGLSFITVLLIGLIAYIPDRLRAGSHIKIFSSRWYSPWVILGMGLIVFVSFWIYGIERLKYTYNDVFPNVQLRLVQPNTAQEQKFKADVNVLSKDYMELSLQNQNSNNPPTHIIWPEAAIDSFLDRLPDLRRNLGTVVPTGGALILGALRAEPLVGPIHKMWNSIYALGSAGNIIAFYDKTYLVPYGEYAPMRSWIPFINNLMPGSLDFSSGLGPQTLYLSGLPPVGMLVCYEVIFPGEIIDKNKRPSWLLNVTNDAWFGQSVGPYQHLTSARYRSIEEGLSLVRVANTGVSAVIDPYGRIIHSMGLLKRGVLDVPLLKPLPELTLYARFGNWIFAFILVINLWIILFLKSRETK
ncbi:MAG: apolipoprotein N-acyltransferase [Alphaproteobacteria bacterium]|nr:apolipoprotein N-acyltransferase [Alphaproteobacteria bacterium]